MVIFNQNACTATVIVIIILHRAEPTIKSIIEFARFYICHVLEHSVPFGKNHHYCWTRRFCTRTYVSLLSPRSLLSLLEGILRGSLREIGHTAPVQSYLLQSLSDVRWLPQVTLSSNMENDADMIPANNLCKLNSSTPKGLNLTQSIYLNILPGNDYA